MDADYGSPQPHLVNLTSNMSNSGIATFRYLGIFIGFIDIFIGVPGNFITILAVLGNKALLRQPFNLFVLNLSFIDLLTALVMMPFNVTGYVQMSWPFERSTCVIQAFSYFCCGYTSIAFLVAITLNRLIGVLDPTRYRFLSATSVKISIAFCWVIAPALLLPTMAATFQALHRGNPEHALTGWKEEQFLCTFVNVDEGWRKYMLFLRFVFQLFPIIIMVFSYAAMYYKIKKTNKHHLEATAPYLSYKNQIENPNSRTDENLHHMLPSPKRHKHPFVKRKSEADIGKVYEIKDGKIAIHCITLSSQKRESLVEKQLREQREMEIHLVHVSIIVCAVITILFLPSFIINLPLNSMSFDPRWHMAASNITWLNSCCNPFIYAFMHKPMQKEYKAVLKRMVTYVEQIFCKIRNIRKN